MRVIICGTRKFDNLDLIAEAVERSRYTITEVVSGGAQGIDRRAVEWAKAQGIPYTIIAAPGDSWRLFGKVAGHIRNGWMAGYTLANMPDAACIAIWDGKSAGTQNMFRQATMLMKNVCVLTVGQQFDRWSPDHGRFVPEWVADIEDN